MADARYTIEFEERGLSNLVNAINKLNDNISSMTKHFKSGVEAANKGLKNLENSGKKSFSEIRNGAKTASNSMKSLVDAVKVDVFLRLAEYATKAFNSIAQSILNVQSKWTELQAITDKKTFQSMLTVIKDIPAELANWRQASEVLYEIQSAGITTTETQKALIETTLKLAKIGAAEPKAVVKLMTTLSSVYKLNADSVKDYGDKLFQLVKDAKITIPELANNLGKVATASKQMGVSFDETLAMIGAFKNAGLSTEESMTKLNAVLRYIARNGGREFIEANKGIVGTINTIAESAKKSGDLLSGLFDITKETEAAQGFAILADQIENVEVETKRLQGSTNAINEAWNKVKNNLDVQVVAMKNAWDNFLASLGVAIAPYLTPLIQKITDLLKYLQGLSEPTKAFIAGLAGITAALVPLTAGVKVFSLIFESLSGIGAVLSGVISGVGQLFSVLSGLWNVLVSIGSLFAGGAALSAGVVVATIASISAAVYELYKHWDDIKFLVSWLWQKMPEGAKNIIAAIMNVGTTILKWMYYPFVKVYEMYKSLLVLIKSKFNFGSGINESHYTGGVVKKQVALLHSGEQVILPSFYSGGVVPSTGIYSLPAGSTVLNRQQVAFNQGQPVVININNPNVDSYARIKELEQTLNSNFISRKLGYLGA